jgi:hypothetical protein
MLLLTTARRNELFEAPSSEIVDGVWTLPPERSKNGEANIIALGPWGRVLAQTNQTWLFPSSRIDGPQRNDWFQARDRIHARMEALAGGRLVRWHFHDLRRTFRSHARGVGIDRDIAELMLNHKRRGIEGIYNRAQELELRAPVVGHIWGAGWAALRARQSWHLRYGRRIAAHDRHPTGLADEQGRSQYLSQGVISGRVGAPHLRPFQLNRIAQ